MKKTVKAISPLIASILLIVVAVILVTIVLAFGKGFTTDALDNTQGVGDILPSDAAHFIFPRAYEEGTIQFTYSPPSSLQGKTISITSYQILELSEVEPITLTTPYTLKEGANTLPLNCLYEHALSSPDFTIQLITEDNTYITIKQRDAGMVCTSTGDGSEATPKIICSAEDLNAVRENLDWNYTLGKDVDLQCFSRQTEDGWVPIGSIGNLFEGSFDGQNHTISNLYIYRPATNYVGLFGILTGNINNVGLKDINIIGQDYVGGLVGSFSGGIIINSYSTGSITGQDYVGGVAGNFMGTSSLDTINYCYSIGSIIGQDYVGGLVGKLLFGTIRSSYSFCDISGEEYVGGLIGDMYGAMVGGRAKNYSSYSVGEVIGGSKATDVGGLIGRKSASYITIENSFYDTNTSGQSDAGKGTPKTTSEMKTQSTFTDWDFSTVWAISPTINDGYPYLQNNSPR